MKMDEKMNKNEIIDLKKIFIFCRKKLVFVCFLMFFSVFVTKSSVFYYFFQVYQNYLASNHENLAFKSGEKLKYKISYGRQKKSGGVLLAGHAQLGVEDFVANNDTVYKLHGFGKTTNFFSLFFKVKHSYKSFIDPIKLQTIKCSFQRKEGKYYNSENILFSSETTVNDMLGTFYRLRTMSSKTFSQQDTIFFSYYYDVKIYESYFINHGEEIIQTKFGKIYQVGFTRKIILILKTGHINTIHI